MTTKAKLFRKKILVGALVAVASVFCVTLCVFQNLTMAAGSRDILATDVIKCLENGSFKTSLDNSDLKNGEVSSFMNGGHSVYVPLGFGNPKGSLTLSCKETVKELLSRSGITIPGKGSSAEERDKFLKSLGYKSNVTQTANQSKINQCFYFTYQRTEVSGSRTSKDNVNTQSICVNVSKDGYIVDTDVKIGGSAKEFGYVKFTYDSKKSKIKVILSGLAKNGTVDVKVGDHIDNLKKDVENIITNNGRGDFDAKKGQVSMHFNILNANGDANVNDTSYDLQKAKYTLTIDDASKRLMTGTLTGGSIASYPAFSEADQFNLYQDYLTKFYKADIKCNLTDTQASIEKSKGYTEIYTCSADSDLKPCYAMAGDHSKDWVGGISNGVFGSDCDFNCVADWLKNYGSSNNTCPPATEDDNNDPKPNNDPTTVIAGDVDRSEIVDCNDFENIGAMQWVLCPTMNNLQYTTSWIDNWTQKWLQIETNLYSDVDNSGSDNAIGENKFGIEAVWGNIRNIANILIIVFLLAVVFSQLTGYGIDNYGIKKMLPKLILMGIVVNLSLYICQLAVDVSNIAGAGLRDLFGAIGNGAGGGAGEPSFLGGAAAGLFAAAGSGGTAAIGAGATTAQILSAVGVTGAAGLSATVVIPVIIALIVLLLVILIAVLIFFLMLGARDIIVMLCVVISPLAFAMYILPNTQYLFKKWWELFKAALIIFPICGAMAGISHTLRALFSNGGDFHWYQIAVLMILPYLGFFLIPILLKNAIAALGKIGGALTSVGNSFRNGGRTMLQGGLRAVQNSEGFKNMQQDAIKNRQSRNSQRTIDRLEALRKQREAEGGDLSKNEKIRLARAYDMQKNLASTDIAAETVLMNRRYAGKSGNTIMEDLDTAIDDGDRSRVMALSNVLISREGSGGANRIANSIAKRKFFDEDGKFIGGNNGSMAESFRALQDNMLENSALGNAMLSKAPDVYQMFTSGGYSDTKMEIGADGKEVAVRNEDGELQKLKEPIRQNLAAHTAGNTLSTQDKDWATASGSTLKRSADAGAFTAARAQSILASSDPAIRSGIQSDTEKNEILQAVAGGFNGNWNDKEAVKAAIGRYLAENGGVNVRDGASNSNANAQIQEIRHGIESVQQSVNNVGNMQQPINRVDNSGGVGNLQQPIRRVNNSGDNNSGRGFNNGAGI